MYVPAFAHPGQALFLYAKLQINFELADLKNSDILTKVGLLSSNNIEIQNGF